MSAAPANPEITLRPARDEDAALLFSWLNEPTSLAAKLRTSQPVQWEAHLAWLEARLGDAGCRIWIGEGPDGPAGQVRLQVGEDGWWEIDVYVAPDRRGRGLAAAMLRRAAAEAASLAPGRPLMARVRHENAASRRLFESLGYRATETRPDHVIFKRTAE